MIDKLMSICISACFLFMFTMVAAIPVLVIFDTDILFWIGLIGELICWITFSILETIECVKRCKK